MHSSQENTYFALADLIKDASNEAKARKLIERIRGHFGLQTVAYFGQYINPRSSEEPYLAVTYSDEWINHYIHNDYVKIDPVIGEGFRTVFPINWRNFDRQDKKVKNLFGESREFGIGRNGVTFPVRDQLGARALFTVTSNTDEVQWNREIRHLLGDLQILAGFVHHMFCRIEGSNQVEYRLAPRELECLKWSCRGKTAGEIGDILGISERTVYSYLDTARHKMNATNIVHAVAKAVARGLIATV